MVEELCRRHGTAPFADEGFDQTDAVTQHERWRRYASPCPAFEYGVTHASVERGQVVVGGRDGGDDGTTVHSVDPGPDVAGLQHAKHML